MREEKEPVTGRSGGRASQEKEHKFEGSEAPGGSQPGQHQTRLEVEARPFNWGLVG